MRDPNPTSTAHFRGHPLHPMLVPLPIGFFVATLLFDLAFWRTGDPSFATGAMLLLAAGLATGLLAGVVGAADFLGDARIRTLRKARVHAVGNGIVVLLQTLSLYLRYRWGLDGVVPAGVILSLLTLGLLAVTGWKGGELVFRHRVAVLDHPDAAATNSPSLNLAEPGAAPAGARPPRQPRR